MDTLEGKTLDELKQIVLTLQVQLLAIAQKQQTISNLEQALGAAIDESVSDVARTIGRGHRRAALEKLLALRILIKTAGI